MIEGEGDDTYRHQCLVRWVITARLEDRATAHKFLHKWKETHKDSRLERDVVAQWERGNRGGKNDWR